MRKDLGGIGAYGGIQAPKIETWLLNVRIVLSVPYAILVLITVLDFFPGVPVSFFFAVLIAIGTALLGLTIFVYPQVARNLRRRENFRLLALASEPSTPTDQLAKLARSQFTDVRGRVAVNPSTPLSVLVNLLGDDMLLVREGVGSAIIQRLDRLPKDLLLKVASGRTPLANSFAKQAVQSPRITASELEEIVSTSMTPIRWGAVFNENLNFSTMVKLLNDPDAFVRNQMRGIIEKMSPKAFDLVLADSDYSEMVGLPREWVLKSLNTPESSVPYLHYFD